MAITLYDITVPVLLRGLDRLAAVLEKGGRMPRRRGCRRGAARRRGWRPTC